MFGKQKWPGIWGHAKLSRTLQFFRRGKKRWFVIEFDWDAKWATLHFLFYFIKIGYLELFFGFPWFAKPIEYYECEEKEEEVARPYIPVKKSITTDDAEQH